MGRCERLKWNRRKLGLTQKELADKIGIGVTTIYKLETDETAWSTIRDATDDAISNIFRDLGSWQCDLESVFDKHTKKDDNGFDLDISSLRKQLKEKRLSLPSKEQLYGSTESGIYNDEAFAYYKKTTGFDKPKNDVCDARIHYKIDVKSSAQYTRLRSPYRGYCYYAWNANPTGGLSGSSANGAFVCSPVCVNMRISNL